VKRVVVLLIAAALLGGVSYFNGFEESYRWNLPEGIPEPRVPADNLMSDKKVELGRRLFYDRRLSLLGQTSCESCHRQELAFTDGLIQAVGATGEEHPRNSMSLVNVAYNSRLTWANHLLDSLEVQALTPMFGDNPVEMGLGGKEAMLLDLLRSDQVYRKQFPKVFPGDQDPYSILNTVRAIASFVRSIVSFNSAYDSFIAGQSEAMNASQLRGMNLFFSERLECFHCHGGLNLTDSSTHSNAVVESVGFHNTGLYNLDINGRYPEGNQGLIELTGERRDMGRFRAPGLRNIGLTAPYMHDGSIETLDAVLDHYQNGGRVISDGPFKGDGSRNPYKSVFIRKFELSPSERADLLAFFDALTDDSVVSSSTFSNPFAQVK
jgi:cytochrome c peroxidase